MRRRLCFGRQNTGGQLRRGHFQGKEGDALTFLTGFGFFKEMARCVEGKASCKGRFAHGRTSRQNDQVGFMQAAHDRVQITETRCRSGDAIRIFLGFGGLADDFGQRFDERFRAALQLPFGGQLVEFFFGDVHLEGSIFMQADGVGVIDDIVAQSNQLAAQIAVENQAGIVFGIDDGYRGAGQIHQVFRSADFVQNTVRRQITAQRDRIGRMPAGEQRGDGLIDFGMDRAGKMEGAQKFRHFLQRVVVGQNRSQQSLFGFDVLGRHAHRKGFGCLIHGLFFR